MRVAIRRIPPVLVLLYLTGVATQASADCPANDVWFGCEDAIGLASNTPHFGYDEGSGWTLGQSCQSACYDLRQGYLLVKGSGGGQISPPCVASLEVSDHFQITNLSPGQNYPFFAELHITTTTPDTARLIARIGEPGSGVERQIRVDIDGSSSMRILQIPLSWPADTPFTLDFDLTIFGLRNSTGDCQAEGRLLFRGLPIGSRVISCQNYDVPVPARLSSWGNLKHGYR